MLALLLLQTVDNDTCDAIALLYRRYERLMFKVALEKLSSEEDAEDAVHDAFVGSSKPAGCRTRTIRRPNAYSLPSPKKRPSTYSAGTASALLSP